jgi:hypothetical protein
MNEERLRVWVCFRLTRGCTPSSPVRERERERERERDVEYVQNGYFLFFKGMTGALAPFSDLVCL